MGYRFTIALLWTCVATSPVRAQEANANADAQSESDAEARDAYDGGAVAFEEGRYSVALALFERAYELSHRPELLYNIGLSLDRLRRDHEALDAFERYLDAAPDSPHRRQVSARITSLRAAIDEEERERTTRESELLASSASPEPSTEEGSSIASKWWFWTVLGVVVLGGVAATVAVVASSGDRIEDPLPGTQGATFATLSWGP